MCHRFLGTRLRLRQTRQRLISSGQSLIDLLHLQIKPGVGIDQSIDPHLLADHHRDARPHHHSGRLHLGRHAADSRFAVRAARHFFHRRKVFHQADHQLNDDYSALKKLLNPTEQASLKQGEVAWIKDRNAQCTQSDNGYEFVAMDCAVSMTNKRDDFIKARERECASTGCVDSELAKEND